MIYILTTKQKNGKKIAAITMGAMALGLVGAEQQANASTRIDDNHVQVEAGDTLSQIADDYGTTVDALVQNNNISNKHLIHIGDKLTIAFPEKGQNVQTNNVTSEQQQVQATTQSTNVVNQPSQPQNNVVTTGNTAKDWIASRESGNNYNAVNGRYIGKYQLDAAYLNGDYSPANQERVANEYAVSRYGSWEAAQAFWQSHNWW